MKFLSPKGAVKDAKELEYLVALHQTTHAEIEEFRNGSVDDEDVRVFLMSRFGIKVTNEQVREYIFKGLAGGDGEGEAIDILEIVAILMIPMLVKVADSVLGSNKRFSKLTDDQARLLPPETIIADVLHDILSDTTDGASSTSNPPQITPLLLRQIFVQYDEFDLVKDEKLIDEMIAVASNGKAGATLDVEAFARALSSDVNLYNPETESRYTEIVNDVFPNGVEEQEQETVGEQKLKKVKTLSHMDYTSDSFIHSLHVSMLWLVIVFSYFFYMLGVQDPDFLKSPNEGFGHIYGYAVLKWLVTMCKLVIMGGLIGFFLGLGNGLPQTSAIGPILGLIATWVIVFIPANKGKVHMMNTDLENNDFHSKWPGMKNFLVVFGVVLIFLQLKNLYDYFFPSFEHSEMYEFLDGIAGSNTKRAYRSKQAGIFKINQLVKNAYELHKQDEKSQERSLLKSKQEEESNEWSTRRTSSKAIALQNYADQVDELEEVGGLVWSVKEYFSGRMAGTEGIWLPSRLLAANAIQFIATIICITAVSILFNDLINFLYPEHLPDSLIIDKSCNTRFDYDKCFFPFEGDYYYTGVGVCRDVSFEGPHCYDKFAPLDDTGLDKLIGGAACKSLEAAYYEIEEKAIETIGYNCSTILGTARDFLVQVALELEDFTQEDMLFVTNWCFAINTMTKRDKARYNEWFADEPDFIKIDAKFEQICGEFGKAVQDEAFTNLVRGNETFAKQAYDICMSGYGNIEMESRCTNLKSPKESVQVYAYEQASDGDNFCVSYVSTCNIDPYKPTRGTCIIGENDGNRYQFDGPTCQSYPDINNTLIQRANGVDFDLTAYFPEKWTLHLTAFMALVAGSIVAVITTAVYIPSAIHTVLKFRCGVIPSLKDPNFLNYRVDLADQTYLIGAMFWGLVVTTVLVTLSVAIVVFLFVQPFTRTIVINILAKMLGLATTIILRSVLCMVFLRTAYAGFYRKIPAFANAFMFGVECWNIALTCLYLISRFGKFLVATSLYTGRIDRPILAEGLSLDLDSLPRIFRQNLLSAEAHRHPFMVQLGGMYLMKLRHKDEFGTKAGSIWRLLFVSALMPWLRKKRIKDDVKIDDEIESLMMSARTSGSLMISSRSAGETSVGETSVGETSVGETSVGETTPQSKPYVEEEP